MHFGNFAGLLSKAIWFALGFAMCYVTLTGVRLWLARRQDGATSLAWLDRLTSVVGLGLPLAIVGCAAAFLIAMPKDSAVFWTPTAFLLTAAAAIVGAFVAPSTQALDRALLVGLAAGMILLPPLRLLCGGPGWLAVISAGQPVIAAIDTALLLAGGWIGWQLRPAQAACRAERLPSLQAEA